MENFDPSSYSWTAVVQNSNPQVLHQGSESSSLKEPPVRISTVPAARCPLQYFLQYYSRLKSVQSNYSTQTACPLSAHRRGYVAQYFLFGVYDAHVFVGKDLHLNIHATRMCWPRSNPSSSSKGGIFTRKPGPRGHVFNLYLI
jgi:hypothetical protein